MNEGGGNQAGQVAENQDGGDQDGLNGRLGQIAENVGKLTTAVDAFTSLSRTRNAQQLLTAIDKNLRDLTEAVQEFTRGTHGHAGRPWLTDSHQDLSKERKEHILGLYSNEQIAKIRNGELSDDDIVQEVTKANDKRNRENELSDSLDLEKLASLPHADMAAKIKEILTEVRPEDDHSADHEKVRADCPLPPEPPIMGGEVPWETFPHEWKDLTGPKPLHSAHARSGQPCKLIRGYCGGGSPKDGRQKSHTRFYRSLEMNDWIEVDNKDILHFIYLHWLSAEHFPRGGTNVWVRRGARLILGSESSTQERIVVAELHELTEHANGRQPMALGAFGGALGSHDEWPYSGFGSHDEWP